MQILLFLVHAFLKSFQIKWQLVEKVYKHTFNAIFDFNDTLTEASKMTNWRSRTHTHTYTHSLTYTHTYSLTHALTHAYTLDHTHTLTHAHSHTYIHTHSHTLTYPHLVKLSTMLYVSLPSLGSFTQIVLLHWCFTYSANKYLGLHGHSGSIQTQKQSNCLHAHVKIKLWFLHYGVVTKISNKICKSDSLCTMHDKIVHVHNNVYRTRHFALVCSSTESRTSTSTREQVCCWEIRVCTCVSVHE